MRQHQMVNCANCGISIPKRWEFEVKFLTPNGDPAYAYVCSDDCDVAYESAMTECQRAYEAETGAPAMGI